VSASKLASRELDFASDASRCIFFAIALGRSWRQMFRVQRKEKIKIQLGKG
jgi:hypothetical protein